MFNIRKWRIGTSNNNERSLVTFMYPHSIISEQFRTIRTNIQFINGEKKHMVLLMTSADRYEGKTTMIGNIAVSIANQKEKVLVIDANLRNPALHHMFLTGQEPGLTEVLKGYATEEDAIISTAIPGLKLLPSGKIPSNPSELLGSIVMKKLIAKVSPLYDVILIDSPCLLDVTDTKVLANVSDGVILVVKQGETKAEHVYNARKTLQYAKSNIIGAIMNGSR